MIRGTTASFKFKLPCKLKDVLEARVVFWQDGYSGTLGNKLPKTQKYYNSDFTDPESSELIAILTETDTRAFTDKLKARVQMKAVYQHTDDNGQVTISTFGSYPQLFTVYPMDDEIMDGVHGEETVSTNNGYVILSGGDIVEVGDD